MSKKSDHSAATDAAHMIYANYLVQSGRVSGMNESPGSYQVGGSHYTDMAIQPWEAMEEWMSEEQYIGYLRGCALKYLNSTYMTYLKLCQVIAEQEEEFDE